MVCFGIVSLSMIFLLFSMFNCVRIFSFSRVFVLVFLGLLILILGLMIGIRFVVRICLFILNCCLIMVLMFLWLVSFIIECILVLNMFCVLVFVNSLLRFGIGFINWMLLVLVFNFLLIFRNGIMCFFCYRKFVEDRFLMLWFRVFLNKIVFNMCLLEKVL